MFYRCSNCKGVYFITTAGPNAELKPICCSGKVKDAKFIPIRHTIHRIRKMFNVETKINLDSPEE